MRRTTRGLVALSAAGALALSACGGDDGGGDGSGSGQPSAVPSDLANTGNFTDPDREGPVTIEGAQEGGTVKVISFTPLETMDPSEIYYTHTNAISTALLNRSLTQFVYDEENNQAVLVPDLATDLGTPNEDFTEWTFTIRDGVKYEDGTPVTAEDVKFGMERTMDVETFPESPGGYAKEYYEGGADYDGPYTGKGAQLDAIKVDGQTITITMAKPFPDMPYWGAFPANGPIPADKAGDVPAYANHPLSTGPYKIADYTPHESLTLVRNDQWDPATDPGRTQYPDGYEFDFTVPSEKIDELLLNDQGDAANSMTFDDVLGTDYRKFQEQAADRLVPGSTPCTRYWAPDYRKITDINIRRAIALAYPTRAVIRASGLIEGVNRYPADALLPPGTPGRKDYTAVEGLTPGDPDPAAAKELLEQAGAVGYELKFLFPSDDPDQVNGKDAIVKGLEEAGFKATPVPTTLENLTTDRENPDKDINIRNAGWCADWPSGGSWFPVLHKTEDVEQLGQISNNYALFSEADVDGRIDDILGLPIEDQAAAWGELDEYISETYLPLIPISYDGVIQAHGSNVNGHYDDLVLGMPTFKSIWLTQ
jgi:peptide/nickel transport system substrate-binding protein